MRAPQPAKAHSHWSPANVAALSALRKRGINTADIAAQIGRSVVAVRSKLRELEYELVKPGAKASVRKCMCCESKFKSWGIGNRLCMRCKLKSE